jgi:hypothetical protein
LSFRRLAEDARLRQGFGPELCTLNLLRRSQNFSHNALKKIRAFEDIFSFIPAGSRRSKQNAGKREIPGNKPDLEDVFVLSADCIFSES